MTLPAMSIPNELSPVAIATSNTYIRQDDKEHTMSSKLLNEKVIPLDRNVVRDIATELVDDAQFTDVDKPFSGIRATFNRVGEQTDIQVDIFLVPKRDTGDIEAIYNQKVINKSKIKRMCKVFVFPSHIEMAKEEDDVRLNIIDKVTSALLHELTHATDYTQDRGVHATTGVIKKASDWDRYFNHSSEVKANAQQVLDFCVSRIRSMNLTLDDITSTRLMSLIEKSPAWNKMAEYISNETRKYLIKIIYQGIVDELTSDEE